MKIIFATMRRELLLSCRHPADVLNPLVFFVLVVSLFPLGVGPSSASLVAPGIIWVAALLATLLSLEALFRSDFDDGSLEQMSLARAPFILLVTGKMISHWLFSGLPLVLLSPLIAIMLAVDVAAIKPVVITLLLGTPTLSLLGSIGAGLTLGLKKGGVLIAIIILPLYAPVLILGTKLIQTALAGGNYQGHILWLGALLALIASIAPIATAASVKLSISQ